MRTRHEILLEYGWHCNEISGRYWTDDFHPLQNTLTLDQAWDQQWRKAAEK